MFGLQFSNLVSLTYSLGFVINREVVREALGLHSPLVIPLEEMEEIIESCHLGVAKGSISHSHQVTPCRQRPELKIKSM